MWNVCMFAGVEGAAGRGWGCGESTAGCLGGRSQTTPCAEATLGPGQVLSLAPPKGNCVSVET